MKQQLQQYGSNNLMSDVKAGEEIDWEDACAVESAKLQQYTFDMLWHYRQHNVQQVSEKK